MQREYDFSPYFTKTLRFESHIEEVFETKIYRPARILILRVSRRLRAIQAGSIHAYLLYIFATLLLLLTRYSPTACLDHQLREQRRCSDPDRFYRKKPNPRLCMVDTRLHAVCHRWRIRRHRFRYHDHLPCFHRWLPVRRPGHDHLVVQCPRILYFWGLRGSRSWVHPVVHGVGT